MRDIVVIAVVAAFFAVCAAYVRWCDRIIGPDPELTDELGEELDAPVHASPDANSVEAVRS